MIKKINKIIVYLGHPAHFHLLKYTLKKLSASGIAFRILIKKKDVLEKLCQQAGLEYTNIQSFERSNNKISIAGALLLRDFQLTNTAREFKPDLLIGTSTELTHVGKLLGIPSIILNEDDHDVIPLFSKLGFPFTTHILSPVSCNLGKWEKKGIKYHGYHKLAYLHPAYFKPDQNLIADSVDLSKPYYLLRFAKLTAHHDKGKRGITTEIAEKLISILSKYGNVYITSERSLEPQLENYRLKINPLHIHHVMNYADLYIGDSQSMAVESAMLGIPGIRFNDFVGKIGVLNELENTYKLTTGIPASNPDKLFAEVQKFLKDSSLKHKFIQRRKLLLKTKIDVTAFITWFIENYPHSVDKLNNFSSYKEQGVTTDLVKKLY